MQIFDEKRQFYFLPERTDQGKYDCRLSERSLGYGSNTCTGVGRVEILGFTTSKTQTDYLSYRD